MIKHGNNTYGYKFKIHFWFCLFSDIISYPHFSFSVNTVHLLFTHIFQHGGYTNSMKKQNHKPDFHKLCFPKQHKNIWTIISQCILFFFSASAAGFLWEVLIFLVKDGQFRNRGFLYGPWLPVYGSGAVLLYLLLRNLKNRPLFVFLLSAAIGTGLELLIGWFLNTAWDLRYWDYTGYFLNFHGYICFMSALGFGAAGMLWVCYISGFFLKICAKIPARMLCIILTLLVLAFLTDCAAALILPNAGRGITF